jgi:hypothetical protein
MVETVARPTLGKGRDELGRLAYLMKKQRCTVGNACRYDLLIGAEGSAHMVMGGGLGTTAQR